MFTYNYQHYKRKLNTMLQPEDNESLRLAKSTYFCVILGQCEFRTNTRSQATGCRRSKPSFLSTLNYRWLSRISTHHQFYPVLISTENLKYEKGSVRDEVLILNFQCLAQLDNGKAYIRNLKKLMETLYDCTSGPFLNDEFVG